jgi:hypothetical protein
MTYKDAIDVALTSIRFSEEKIRDHDYGSGDWVSERRRNELDSLYSAKVKLRKLKKKC